MITQPRATIEDLYKEPGKAELINGEIVRYMATGRKPGYAGDEIYVALRAYARQRPGEIAVGDNKAFVVHLSHRQSFSPDAAYYVGPNSGMKFFQGAPLFAVEVRSENDYGPAAEEAMEAKRADYFAAGTRIVWDVDVEGDIVVRKYTAENPHAPTLYRRGDRADAEPALPGWTMPVDDLFEPEETTQS